MAAKRPKKAAVEPTMVLAALSSSSPPVSSASSPELVVEAPSDSELVSEPSVSEAPPEVVTVAVVSASVSVSVTVAEGSEPGEELSLPPVASGVPSEL